MTDLTPAVDQDSVDESNNPILPEAFAESGKANKEREARKQQKRIDAREWAPRESVAVIYRDLTLGSPTLSKAWNALFVRAQIAMHMLQEVLPSTGELEQARVVEKLVDERLTTLEAEYQNEYSRLIAIAKADGYETIPEKCYPGMQPMSVPVFTPGSGRYLALLTKVDNLFWLTDYLWINGLLKTDHKWQIVNRWKRLLWDFVKFSTQTWIRARSSLRNTQEARNRKRNGTASATEAAPAPEESLPVAA